MFVYHELFSGAQWIGFSLGWMALILFGVEGVLAHRARPRAAAAS